MIAEIDEKRLRKKIADQVKQGFMPICRCEKCGTLEIGILVERIIESIEVSK